MGGIIIVLHVLLGISPAGSGKVLPRRSGYGCLQQANLQTRQGLSATIGSEEERSANVADAIPCFLNLHVFSEFDSPECHEKDYFFGRTQEENDGHGLEAPLHESRRTGVIMREC
jgi:hypothetical protein